VAENHRYFREDSMKHSVMAMCLFLLFGGMGLRGQGPAPQDSQQDAQKEHSMTGCLQKGAEAGTFRLTDVEKGPKSVDILDSTANLAPHLGHKVEITGTSVTAKDPQSHAMKVTGVKMLAATCP
jgi:hypothetical protein